MPEAVHAHNSITLLIHRTTHKDLHSMKRIVLLRHGQSLWNLENRFTGWTDVDLTGTGIDEARKAGRLMFDNGFDFRLCYTSYLCRAIHSLNCVLQEMNLEWIEVRKSWRLNEKHYGTLQGLDKRETAAKYGEQQVMLWRRSYDTAPAPLSADDPANPRFDPRYADVPESELPLTESLRQTIARTLPYWLCEIMPSLRQAGQILGVAHGNSLRGIIKHRKGISDEDIACLNLPTAVPYVFEFDEGLNPVRDYFLGDDEQIRKAMAEVAAQGRTR